MKEHHTVEGDVQLTFKYRACTEKKHESGNSQL